MGVKFECFAGSDLVTVASGDALQAAKKSFGSDTGSVPFPPRNRLVAIGAPGPVVVGWREAHMRRLCASRGGRPESPLLGLWGVGIARCSHLTAVARR